MIDLMPGFGAFTDVVSGGASSTATFNPADKGATIVLSDGNKTAANSDGSYSSAPGVRSTIPALAGGKHYIEFVGGNTASAVGFANLSASLADYPSTVNAIQLYVDSGDLSRNGSSLGTFGDGNGTDVWSWVVDLVNNKIDVKKNNGSYLLSYNPADGSGGWTIAITGDLYFATWIYGNFSTNVVRVNASEWTFSAPAGFTEWGI